MTDRLDSKPSPIHQEPKPSTSWYNRWFEQKSPDLQKGIQTLRDFFQQLGPRQSWYYAGAGGDIGQCFFAPPDTHHWLVDLTYRQDSFISRNLDYSRVLTHPFIDLGADVTARYDWQELSVNGHQTLVIGTDTIIDLRGGLLTEPQNYPESDIDVIYTSGHTPISHEALTRLKVGGIYMILEDKPSSKQLTLSSPFDSITYERLGIKKVGSGSLRDLNLPGIGTAGHEEAGTTRVTLLRKTAEFSPETSAIIRMSDHTDTLHNLLREACFHNCPFDDSLKLADALKRTIELFKDSYQNPLLPDYAKKVVRDWLKREVDREFLDKIAARLLPQRDKDMVKANIQVATQYIHNVFKV